MCPAPKITIQYYNKKRKEKSKTGKIVQQFVAKIPFFFRINLIKMKVEIFFRNGVRNGKKEKGVF